MALKKVKRAGSSIPRVLLVNVRAPEDEDGGVILGLRRVERGYYMSDLVLSRGTTSTMSLHVEAIQLTARYGCALNEMYQERIDRWVAANEGMDFERLEISGREYFINIEPYAR
jgi:hypothetical protein